MSGSEFNAGERLHIWVPTYAALRFHLHCVQNLTAIRGRCTEDCAMVVGGEEDSLALALVSDISMYVTIFSLSHNQYVAAVSVPRHSEKEV